MPYIKKNNKLRFSSALNKIIENTPDNCGELNFLFTCIAHLYIESKGENYQNYNDIIGALENCKLELYRRKISIYEDEKIKENGDV